MLLARVRDSESESAAESAAALAAAAQAAAAGLSSQLLRFYMRRVHRSRIQLRHNKPSIAQL